MEYVFVMGSILLLITHLESLSMLIRRPARVILPYSALQSRDQSTEALLARSYMYINSLISSSASVKGVITSFPDVFYVNNIATSHFLSLRYSEHGSCICHG